MNGFAIAMQLPSFGLRVSAWLAMPSRYLPMSWLSGIFVDGISIVLPPSSILEYTSIFKSSKQCRERERSGASA